MENQKIKNEIKGTQTFKSMLLFLFVISGTTMFASFWIPVLKEGYYDMFSLVIFLISGFWFWSINRSNKILELIVYSREGIVPTNEDVSSLSISRFLSYPTAQILVNEESFNRFIRFMPKNRNEIQKKSNNKLVKITSSMGESKREIELRVDSCTENHYIKSPTHVISDIFHVMDSYKVDPNKEAILYIWFCEIGEDLFRVHMSVINAIVSLDALVLSRDESQTIPVGSTLVTY